MCGYVMGWALAWALVWAVSGPRLRTYWTRGASILLSILE